MIPACLLVLIPGAVFIARAREIRPFAAAAAAARVRARAEFHAPLSPLAGAGDRTNIK